MKNRTLLFLMFIVGIYWSGCSQKSNQQPVQNNPQPKDAVLELPEQVEPIKKADSDWKSLLSEMEFNVLREKGTERAFTGDLWDHKSDCVYTCAGCGLPLFDSNTKFKSGSGWPSYYQPLKEKYVKEEKDVSFGMTRIEVLCARCDGHLGHVFNDGPQPTGLRYCINSASLNFIEKEKEN